MNLGKKVLKFVKDNKIESFKFIGTQPVITSYCRITNLTVPVKFDIVGDKLAEVYLTSRTKSNFDFRSSGVIVNFRRGEYDFSDIEFSKDIIIKFSKGCILNNMNLDLSIYLQLLCLSDCEFNNCIIKDPRAFGYNIYSCIFNNSTLESDYIELERCKINSLLIKSYHRPLIDILRFYKSEVRGLSVSSNIHRFEIYGSFIDLDNVFIKSEAVWFSKTDFNNSKIVFSPTEVREVVECKNYNNIYVEDVKIKDLIK